MTVRPIAGALLAAVAIGLSACGGGDAGGAASAASAEEAALKFARCMREQGIDFPDPGTGEEGFTQVGPAPGDEPRNESRFRDAEKACAKYRDAMRPPELSDEQESEMQEAALRHARCMREHGVDFPDPQFPDEGGAVVKIGQDGVDPTTPRFRAAEEKCRGLLRDIGGVQQEANP